VVGHDDLEVYERAQQGLASRARDWLNLARLYEPGEQERTVAVTNGTNELQMRNQMRAWVRFMTADMPEGVAA
jgi:hypothetical protein